MLKEVNWRFPGKPIFITENGIADATDTKRARFLLDHLAVLHRAIQEGIPVVGYCHWSLMDNFEWIEGFVPATACMRSITEHRRGRFGKAASCLRRSPREMRFHNGCLQRWSARL